MKGKWRLASAITLLSIAATAPATGSTAAQPIPKEDAVYAGYGVVGKPPYTYVTSEWRVPTLRCGKSEASRVAIWVGSASEDALTARRAKARRLPQAGTYHGCGTFAWQNNRIVWQIAGQQPMQMEPGTYDMRSGDRIETAVERVGSSTTFHFTLENKTRQWLWQHDEEMNKAGSISNAGNAAWWIVEAPTGSVTPWTGMVSQLANFGTVTISEAIARDATGSFPGLLNDSEVWKVTLIPSANTERFRIYLNTHRAVPSPLVMSAANPPKVSFTGTWQER